MPEVISWPEGEIYVWTGTATASARIAYATDMSVKFARNYINRRTISGSYYDLVGDERADVTVGALLTVSTELFKVFESATAVHMHLRHSANPYGTGGYFLYSGRISMMEIIGSEAGVLNYSMTYYANKWSGYGP